VVGFGLGQFVDAGLEPGDIVDAGLEPCDLADFISQDNI
jgi:hypothetical protein